MDHNRIDEDDHNDNDDEAQSKMNPYDWKFPAVGKFNFHN